MKPRTHNVLTVSALSVCGLALTGLKGVLPAGAGTVVMVSLGLFGLALFPSIAPTDATNKLDAEDAAESDPTAS